MELPAECGEGRGPRLRAGGRGWAGAAPPRDSCANTGPDDPSGDARLRQAGARTPPTTLDWWPVDAEKKTLLHRQHPGSALAG